MYLFSIECTIPQTAIAIMKDKKIAAKKSWNSFDACKEILPAIDNLLEKTRMSLEKIDFFVVSSGPGSWTGIRLGFALAYGLAVADAGRVYGVSSIDAMAYRFVGKSDIAVFLPSVGRSLHYGFFKKPENLSKKNGLISTCTTEEIFVKLKDATIIAGPDKKILSLFKSSGKIVVNISPDPVLNAMLALERIKNSVSSAGPYYEK